MFISFQQFDLDISPLWSPEHPKNDGIYYTAIFLLFTAFAVDVDVAIVTIIAVIDFFMIMILVHITIGHQKKII